MRALVTIVLVGLTLTACADRGTRKVASDWCTRGGVEAGTAAHDECFRTDIEGRTARRESRGLMSGDVAPSIGDAGSRF
jgi:hypothetical protein